MVFIFILLFARFEAGLIRVGSARRDRREIREGEDEDETAREK